MGCGSSSPTSENTTAPPPGNAKKTGEDKSGQSNKKQVDEKKVDISQFKDNATIGAMLKNVPLLSKLSEAERNKLGGALVPKKFVNGDKIITQGEIGNGFFIISKGEVQVLRTVDADTSELAKLKEGDFFGETALINNAKRGATVVAIGAVETFYLERDHFNALFGHDRLNVQFAKRQAVSSEAVKGGKGDKKQGGPPANAETTKTAAQTQLIAEAMKNNVLFANLDEEHKAQIIQSMYKQVIKTGIDACKQGEKGDELYVIESGEFNIFVNGKKVAVRGKGTCFGELALMYNSPRAATVTAATDCTVWVVDRYTFRKIVTDVSEKKFDVYVGFLKRVDLLTPLAEYERKKIAEALEETEVKPGQVIFKQGDEGDALYLVYQGEVKITKSENGGEAKEVMRCKVGDYFGERALMTNEPRAATATSVATGVLLRLDRQGFNLLLGPLEDIMKQNLGKYDEKKDNGKAKSTAAAAAASAKELPKINFNDLKVLGTLGKGSFGHVQLVQDRKDANKTYALKAVSKAQIVQTGQQGHVMSEKRAMQLFDHPFLIRLFATFKDKNRLYFLLEPSLGGELFSVLRERTLFDEDTARFYAASVVLAFDYMHSLNIIYRDLKPENLLLDSQGFLKVTDFGFAKDISSGRTWTLCGTPDYLAPEIVAGKGHGKGVDWWTLGVFIYEMLASYPPFYDEDPMKTYAKIMHGAINFPSHFSKEAVSLIKKLLQHKATKRLGVVKGGAAEIKKHPWFKNFDFDALYNHKMKPPIVPKIKSNIDMSNFDEYQDDGNDVEDYVDDGSNWDEDF